jgi:Kef-type K+ transport system membrane component KefB
MSKKIRKYLIAIVVVFLVVLLVGYFFVELAWSESAFLSAFLTVISVGGFWWREEGLG